MKTGGNTHADKCVYIYAYTCFHFGWHSFAYITRYDNHCFWYTDISVKLQTCWLFQKSKYLATYKRTCISSYNAANRNQGCHNVHCPMSLAAKKNRPWCSYSCQTKNHIISNGESWFHLKEIASEYLVHQLHASFNTIPHFISKKWDSHPYKVHMQV